MIEVNMDSLIERTKHLEDAASEEVIDLYCEIGALIGVLSSRDSLFLGLLGKGQYEDALKELMKCQIVLYPLALTSMAEVATRTDTYKKSSGNFSAY